MTWSYLLFAGLAAFGAGLVNALAGGGTLLSFPMLTALGLPALSANVTNTVALGPGYLGATLAQRRDFGGQKSRLWVMVPVSAAGGLTGALLLVHTSERAFRTAVPFLILLASALLAVQDPVRAWLARRGRSSETGAGGSVLAAVLIGVASIYGGYFGAGLSVVVLAVLGLLVDDTLTRLNALKHAIALSLNAAAAIFFAFTGRVVWPMVVVMAAGAIGGGALGGRLAGSIKPSTLRLAVVTIGVIVAGIYFVK